MQNLHQSTIIPSPLFQPIYSLDQEQQGCKLGKLPSPESMKNINNQLHEELKKAFGERLNVLRKAVTLIQSGECTPEDIESYGESTTNSLESPLKNLASRIKLLEADIFKNATELSGLHASFWGNNYESFNRFGSDFRLEEAKVYVSSSATEPNPSPVSEHKYLSNLKTTLEECVKLKEAAYSLLLKLDGIGTNPSLNLENRDIVDSVYNQKNKIEQIKTEANKIYNILSYESKKLKEQVFELAQKKDKVIDQLNKKITESEKTIKNAQGDAEKISKANNKLADAKYTIEQINTYFAAINHRLEESYGILYESHEFGNAITKLKEKYGCKDVEEERKPLTSYTSYADSSIESELFNHQYKVAQFKEIQKEFNNSLDRFAANLTEEQKANHNHIQSLAFQNFGNLKQEHARLENIMNNRIIQLNFEIRTKGGQLKELRSLFSELNTQLASLKAPPAAAGGWLSSVTSYAVSWMGYSSSPTTTKKEQQEIVKTA